MDLPIRPKTCNLHKPRIRIVERRETVFEIRQPDYDVVRDESGQLAAIPSGRFLGSTVFKELATAMECAPRGAARRPAYALQMAGHPYMGKPIMEASA